ncbi:hypothetical protein Glove_134g167 [Diversispora epigaea]|uniref:Uncharacterized protein n=1 Tax=Diversispora epigaea TaxID=1348612 RepID=A0A397J3L0_9GLOM|nr:hypothetical protein Glove_134g167 [Diversispora epigaea]
MEQTSTFQTVHFLKKLESIILETVDELKTENQKLKKEIVKFKRQNSQMEIDFEEKLEKSQENINQMKEEIDFLVNINQQFKSILVKSSPSDSGKRVFGNNSKEEDTESDNEKNEKDARINNSNEMKTIIKTINSEFSLNYNQTFISVNNCEIRHKLIPELQKSLASKFRPSIMQLTKWLNTIARMHNSEKLPKNLCRVHTNNRQNNKKFRRIKVAKELFKKNDLNITNYDKELLLRMLANRTFHLPEMFDTDEENHLKTVLKHLFRNILNSQLTSSTTAQSQQKRNYSDEIQQYDFPLQRKLLTRSLTCYVQRHTTV